MGKIKPYTITNSNSSNNSNNINLNSEFKAAKFISVIVITNTCCYIYHIFIYLIRQENCTLLFIVIHIFAFMFNSRTKQNNFLDKLTYMMITNNALACPFYHIPGSSICDFTNFWDKVQRL